MSNTNEVSNEIKIAQLEYQLRCVLFNIEKTRKAIIAIGKGGSRAMGNFHGKSLTESRRSEKSLNTRLDALRAA